MNPGTVEILGYQVTNAGLDGSVEHVMASLQRHTRPLVMACLNPHSVVTAAGNSRFRTALDHADILLPDGIGIVLAGRVLGHQVNERVAGFEFFERLCERTNEIGDIGHFFLGSTHPVLERVRERIARDYPRLRFAGCYSPPFKAEFSVEDNQMMIDAVNSAAPDVLWVGMTAPKQEMWIRDNVGSLNVPFVGAIGAVFDFYSGNKSRAPKWVRSAGMEWLPRLLREPKRLFRRNFVSTPLFLAMLAKALYRRKSN